MYIARRFPTAAMVPRDRLHREHRRCRRANSVKDRADRDTDACGRRPWTAAGCVQTRSLPRGPGLGRSRLERCRVAGDVLQEGHVLLVLEVRASAAKPRRTGPGACIAPRHTGSDRPCCVAVAPHRIAPRSHNTPRQPSAHDALRHGVARPGPPGPARHCATAHHASWFTRPFLM